MGLIPAGAYRNRSYTEEKIEMGDTEEALLDIFFDPQTSGGLLISVTPEAGEQIMNEFKTAEMENAYAIIGKVIEKGEHVVRLQR